MAAQKHVVLVTTKGTLYWFDLVLSNNFFKPQWKNLLRPTFFFFFHMKRGQWDLFWRSLELLYVGRFQSFIIAVHTSATIETSLLWRSIADFLQQLHSACCSCFEKDCWYFVSKIGEKIFLVITRGWRPRICKNAEITRTIHLNSEKSVQFLKEKLFFSQYCPAAQTSPELIFLIISMSQDSFVSLSVIKALTSRIAKLQIEIFAYINTYIRVAHVMYYM